jgi:hypothetical protein
VEDDPRCRQEEEEDVRVEHTLSVVARCPVNASTDVYECVVRTDHVVFVEDILKAVAELTTEPITQEDLTRHMADRLGVEVETVGIHSNVRTRVTCDPPE